METFRVRNSAPDHQRKILLPLSFGVSSVVLLQILDYHLKTQKAKTGRTGFSLIVLFVDCSSVENAAPNAGLLGQVSERYSDHQYATVPLEDICRIGAADDALLDLLPDSSLKKSGSPLERLWTLMNSLTSATARADVIPILRTRLIVEEARRFGCEGILWGDSTTKLAEKTLAETAKGRGFSLPWQIADGESPFGVTFNYPLRDVLKKELVSYIDLLDPPLRPLVDQSSLEPTHTSMSSKNTTIDDLMKQYFESVEENFPSIVANVVRTTSKLEAKPTLDSDPRCKLCKMPVSDSRFGIHGWGGDQQDGLEESSVVTTGLCYGCTRAIPTTKSAANAAS
jgi:cytoplasmic tRNA 2-thiolation protein 2